MRVSRLVLVVVCLMVSGMVMLFGMNATDQVQRGKYATVDYLHAQLRLCEEQLKRLLDQDKKAKLDNMQLRGASAGSAGGDALGSPGSLGSSTSSSKGAFLGFNRSSNDFNGTLFHHTMAAADESLLQELLFRRNTRYWLESKAEWPAKPIAATEKFVTFSPWIGGFNNIRMSLEMAVAFAASTGRTLVMPPEYDMYLRGKSSLESYFDYNDLARGVSLITYDEFFKLTDFGKYQKEKPGTPHKETERYYEGLKAMPEGEVYDTGKVWGKNKWGDAFIGGQVVYCFPNCPNEKAGSNDNNSPAYKERTWFENYARDLRRFDGDDPAITKAKIVHFPQNLLGHFYTFVFHRDIEKGRRIKRIVRDHVHFRDEIFQLAERIINKLQDFKFSCLHIRHNDFPYKEAWISADEIVDNTKRFIKEGETVYIATDEIGNEKKALLKSAWNDPTAMVKKAEHTWFTPMKEKWGKNHVVFLSDFWDELLKKDTPSIWIGCVESVVCSRARVFAGTRKSTFSGYIQRLRGYMPDVGQKLILDVQSNYPSDYYMYFKGPEWFQIKNSYGTGEHPYWGREYKDAWEGVFASPSSS